MILRAIPRVRTLGCGSFGRVRFAKYKPERFPVGGWALGEFGVHRKVESDEL
jgi:hypothetical protein